ncbi:MAG: hypothetical protein LH614_19230 [Pyrinomonadaceae bacterium]|nr:hypothetical protein [Pyrinomonadaceae bacterium]
METATYKKIIVSGIKGLPTETLREIADFVYFVRRRAVDPKSFEDEQFRALVTEDLSNLNETESEHLEAEFADYESVYPRR